MRSSFLLVPPLLLSACVLSTNGLGTDANVGAGGQSAVASSSAAVTASVTASASSAVATSSSSSSSGQGGAQPTCADQAKNGLETDVDCGGDACGPCKLGQVCNDDGDCVTGVCTAGVCGPAVTGCKPAMLGDQPTCNDCVTNGSESDVDCGGDACGPCALGKACSDGADCVSGDCTSGTCVTSIPGCQPAMPGDQPTCNDCVTNGSETDDDCGGDTCGPCALGKACDIDADCGSGDCTSGTCVASNPVCQPPMPNDQPTCNDCTKNGLETDVDCGGDACLPCVAGKICLDASDCLSGLCAGGICQKGAIGKPCRDIGDCANSQCGMGNCWTGLCCQ